MRPSAEELERRVKEATAWLEFGESLLAAARRLAEPWPRGSRERTEPQRLLELGVLRGTMLLLGAGIECSLKALAVHKDRLSAVNPKLKFADDLNGAYSHDLPALAKSLGIGLSDEQSDFLRRASTFLVWAGRYPVARTLDRSVRDLDEVVLRFGPNDLDHSCHIMERVRGVIEGNGG